MVFECDCGKLAVWDEDWCCPDCLSAEFELTYVTEMWMPMDPSGTYRRSETKVVEADWSNWEFFDSGNCL
jgi:hypothetical protein